MMALALTIRGGRTGDSAARRLRRFRREEDGSTVIFAMFIFTLMLMIGGMAVDIVRFEALRTKLQSTLDGAVLAAADLDQTLDPVAVVYDHFDKAGLSEYQPIVEVIALNANRRDIRATASADVNMMFLRMLGIDEMTAPASGRASEAMSDIEVVLVLDVSGSMVQNGSTRLANLKDAATDFVDEVLSNDPEQRISIGVVPFNGQVNLGPQLRAWHTGVQAVVGTQGITANAGNANTVPTNLHCVDLPASVYTSQSIARTLAMPATQWADTFSTVSRVNRYIAPGTATYAAPGSTQTNTGAGRPVYTNTWCPNTAANNVMLPTRNIANLNARINAMVGIGATSINAGMRWGMTLLDPNSRPMFTAMALQGQMPTTLAGRPFDYGRQNTRKIIVLMTDGSNFAEERVNAAFRTGVSPIRRSIGDGNYSIFHDRAGTTNDFWVPHLDNDGNSGNGIGGRWQSTPWNSGGGVVQLTWPQVWSELRMHWVAWHLYSRPIGGATAAFADAQLNQFRTLTPIEDMNDQLQDMCTRARNNGIEVFGIAFEAPQAGQDEIFECSSSVSHYYYVEPNGSSSGGGGQSIQDVFGDIAEQIVALRLVQ